MALRAREADWRVYPPTHNAQVVMVVGSVCLGDPTPATRWD